MFLEHAGHDIINEKGIIRKGSREMRALKVIFKILLVLILILLIGVGAGIGMLTAFQYDPDDTEYIDLVGKAELSPEQGKPIKVMTWNIGYGALGDNADFFMDGGKSVFSADEERVHQNMDGIKEAILDEDADVYFLQEVDRDSDRSRHVDQEKEITDTLKDEAGAKYQTMFAHNFKTLFVPFPIPPLGKVDSGIMTATCFRAQRADRIKLPCPFKWPVSTVNLKRCLLVTRVRLSGSSKYLVLVNLHLEAYDEGEGKVEQTKALLKVMEEEYAAGNYVVAGGDFNQSFDDVDLSNYPEVPGTWQPGVLSVSDFQPDFTPIMDNTVPTCRSLDKPLEGLTTTQDHQFYMIDGFIVSNNIKVNSIETKDLGFISSDHNPVVMEMILK